MPSLQTGLTTAPRSMLASLPVDWGVWIESYVLLPVYLAAYLNLFMYLSTCLIFSTGSLLSSGFSYRIASLVWRCLLGIAPLYLRELCCPFLSAMSSRSLRSSQQGLVLVPFARTSTKQSRGGFLNLEWAPYSTSYFPKSLVTCVFSHLKTAPFSRAGVGSASE